MTFNKVGFLIKKQDFGHSDEIVTILTNEGEFSFFSVGSRTIKSKNKVSLQIGNLIEIEYFKSRLSNKLSKLKRASTITKPNINEFKIAEIIFKIYKRLSKIGEVDRRFFSLLIEIYSYIDELKWTSTIEVYFLYKMISFTGYPLVMDKCLECGRKDRIVDFNFIKGGFICALHSEENKSIEYLKSFTLLNQGLDKFLSVDSQVVEMLNEQLNEFVDENYFK